jgi:hypothetical protein
VLTVLLIGAGRSRSGGPAKGRAAVALEAHRSCGKGCWGGRKLNCKGRGAPADHSRTKAALDWGSEEVWAPVDGGPKARRRSGGRWRSEQRNRGRRCVCNTRSSVLETPGRARVQEQDVTKWWQELSHRRRVWQSRQRSGKSSATWRHTGRPAQGREGGGAAEA